MYSVLIQNQKTIESFHEFHPFFMEALDRNNVGCCRWIESGTTLDTALPELSKMTDDKEEWRAIIVRVEDESNMREFATTPENPYDFKVNQEGADRTHESPVPLIRLTHILGGVPAPELEFECRRIEEKAKAARTIYIPKRSAEKEADHAILSRKYDYNGKLPKEIYLITLRNRPKSELRKEAEDSWSNQTEINSSEFWKRNNYPSVCRFMVYDYVNEGSVQKNADMFNFWCSVMLLATNEIDSSSLQAYKLYCLYTEFDRKQMSGTFQKKATLLASTRNYLAEEIRRDNEKKLSVNRELPHYQMEIPVYMEMPTYFDVKVDTEEFRLCPKTSNEDHNKWDGMSTGADYALQGTFKQAERALNESAGRMRYVSKMHESEVEALDFFQEEDVREDLSRLYDKILRVQGTLPSVKLKKTEQQEKLIVQIKEDIEKRIDKYAAIECLIILVGLAVLAGIPAGIFLAWQKLGSIPGIAAFVAGIFVILALTELILLVAQRRKMLSKIDDYNEELNNHIINLTQNIKIYTDFVSSMVSYSRGCSYLNILKVNKLKVENSYNVLQKHLRAVNLFTDKLKTWSEAFYLSVNFNLDVYAEAYLNLDITPRHNGMYTFEEGKQYQIPLNETGDMIVSPFEFVRKFNIIREELYEDARSLD